MYPENLKYSKTHEWALVRDDIVRVGITYYAQKELGDVTAVDLPDVGDEANQFEEIGAVDSVKAASEIYAPVGGRVVAVNEKLFESPELVNQDPYGEGWFLEIEMRDPSDLDRLLTADQYRESIEREG
ncbi:MAG: glycine cleavage system protein GcvH [bacterium]